MITMEYAVAGYPVMEAIVHQNRAIITLRELMAMNTIIMDLFDDTDEIMAELN